MSRQRRAAEGASHVQTTARGGARDRLRDASSKDLAQLAQKLGNDRVQGLLQQATGKRDALLGFVQQRLAQVKIAQQAELRAMTKDRVWFDEVARGKGGFKLPDPTRWRGPALLYKKAVQALCAGDLGRGAQLLEKAVEAERAAFEAMPAQVNVPSTTVKADELPDEAAFVTNGETCPATRAPEALAAADAIVRVSDLSPLQPMPPSARQHRGWWDVDAEAEEKKDEKKKPAAEGEGRTPAIEAPERPKDEAPREEVRPEAAAEERAPEKKKKRAPEKKA